MTAEWAEQPASTDNGGIPGRTLAAQREALGWTVEQVADQLKLAVRQVIALEAGDYPNLPSPAVVRGFVRAYAKVVRLDPVPLVAQIALDTPTGSDGNTSATVRRDNKPTSFSEVRFPSNGKRASSLPLGLIAAVVVVAAVAVGAWKFNLLPGAMFHSTSAGPTAPAAASSGASVSVLPTPVVPGQIETTLVKPGDELKPLQNPSVPLISVPPPSAASAPAGAAATAATVAMAPAGPTQAAKPAAGANTLVLNVKADSWLEVRRAKGAPLLSKLGRAGTTETVEVTEPVTLIVGKPASVDATLRGAAVPLPSIAGGTVARVSIK